MSVPLYDVVLTVCSSLDQIESKRQENERAFADPHEGLLELHSHWQQLMTNCRNRNYLSAAAMADLVRLAAVSIKYVSDLSRDDPELLKQIASQVEPKPGDFETNDHPILVAVAGMPPDAEEYDD